MQKICKTHGLTEFSISVSRPRCRKCTIDAVNKRRRKLKLMAVEYKGGKCSICGYSKCVGSLDFHHTDPTQKSFGISSSGHTKSWRRMKAELDKCILICRNCHGELHSNC